MMILTVLAAGAVIVGTGMVAVNADSSKRSLMSKSRGNTFMVLALSASANLKTFEKVVHSELDDTPSDDLPGYNVVVRDCQTSTPDIAWRRFRSYLQEAKNAAFNDRVGVVLDAYGLLAMLWSFSEAGGEQYVPDFVIAMSPVDFKTSLDGYETMACERPGEPKDSKTVKDLEDMRKSFLDKDNKFIAAKENSIKEIMQGVKHAVLSSIESPFEMPDYLGQVSGTPTRGFLTFDKNTVCASWMAGGAWTAEELSQARLERERLEKESRSSEPTFAEELRADAKNAKEAVFRGEVKGRKYCGGHLKRLADQLLRQIPIGPSQFQEWADKNEEKINRSVRGVFDAADRRREAEHQSER